MRLTYHNEGHREAARGECSERVSAEIGLVSEPSESKDGSDNADPSCGAADSQGSVEMAQPGQRAR